MQEPRLGEKLGALGPTQGGPQHVGHCLNSLKGCHIGDYIGDYYKVYQGGGPQHVGVDLRSPLKKVRV